MKMFFAILVLLACALSPLTPATAAGTDGLAQLPADGAERTAGDAGPVQDPGTPSLPADEAEQPAGDAGPVQDPGLPSLPAAQEAATQELAGLYSLLAEAWRHIRFWAVAALAAWFSKKTWQGVA